MDEPAALMVFARASKPNAALKVVGDWTHLPMPGSEEVATLVAGESLSNLIDLDQPIDFALTLDGHQPHGAISAAVRSLDEAKIAFSKFKLVPGPNGVLRIDGLGKVANGDSDGRGKATDEDDAPRGDARYCELAPSFGAAATRLICAESERTLSALGPFLARTAPRRTFPADVHVEFRFAVVRPLVEQTRRLLPMLAGSALGLHHTGIPELDDAFRSVVDDVADFASDADSLTLDAMLGEPQGTVTMTGQFRSSTSLLARLAIAHSERAGAPPAAFWKLPSDSDAAFFQGGIDASDFTHARDQMAGVVGALLGKGGMDEEDRKVMKGVAADTLDLLSQPSVYAKGLDLEGAAKAVAALAALGDGDPGRLAAESAAEQKMAGWSVFGVNAPAGKLVAVEKEWAAAWARPGVSKWLKSKVVGETPPAVKMAPLPPGIGGKDAAHLEIVVYPNAPRSDVAGEGKGKATKPLLKAAKPRVLHAVVVPDGAASWLVLAADESLAVAKAKELLAGSGGLAARDGLAPLKDAKLSAGGFLSPRAFAAGDVIGWTLAPKVSKLGDGSLGALDDAPDHGTTPILLTTKSQAPAAGGGAAGAFTVTGTLPKGAIEALVRMAMH